METAAVGLAKRLANIEPHRFKPGENGKPRYRDQLAAKIEMLNSAYAADTPAQQILISLAARHLVDADRARATARVRSTNAALRCLADVPKRPPAAPPPLSSYRRSTP
jgi:hypothetical protein